MIATPKVVDGKIETRSIGGDGVWVLCMALSPATMAGKDIDVYLDHQAVAQLLVVLRSSAEARNPKG